MEVVAIIANVYFLMPAIWNGTIMLNKHCNMLQQDYYPLMD